MGRGSACAFTLVELMVAIALFAIVGSLAVPAYRNFVAGVRAVTEINGFARDFQYARLAAMRGGTDVTLCASRDGAACNGASWGEGWIVFADASDDRDVDPGEPLLRVHAALANGDRLIGNRNLAHHITFNRFGMLAGVYNGTVVLHPNPERVADLRCLVISGIGKLRAESGRDCVP